MTEPSLRETPGRGVRRVPPAAALAAGLFAALLAIVAFTALQAAYANALCCGDDAAMAVVAKNLVRGAGYSISIESNGQPGIFPFSPDISSGPAVIFPAALGIAVLGNRTWVPGVTEALTVVVLLGLIAWYAGRRTTAVCGAAFGALLVVGALGVTIRHFEHWHALLGELPAALYAVLALGVLSLGPRIRRAAFIGGLVLGLAIAAKLLAIFAAAGFAVVAAGRIAYRLWRRAGPVHEDAIQLACALGGTVLPAAAFELYKAVVLGPGRYAANAAQELAFMISRNNGAGRAAPASGGVFQTAAAHDAAFGEHFGFSLLALAAVCAIALFVVLTRARHAGVRVFGCSLAAGSAIALGWWLFASVGWPRYALIGLVLAAALMACAAFVRPASAALVALLMLVVVVRPHAGTIAATVQAAFAQGFAENERVRHLHETAAYLAAHPGVPLLSGWWATAVDLEYALPGVGNFTRWDHAGSGMRRRGWLVRDELWVGFFPQPGFDAFEHSCARSVWRDEPYRISSCTVATGSPAAPAAGHAVRARAPVAGAPPVPARAVGWARGHLDEVLTVPPAADSYDAGRRTIVADASADVLLRGWAMPSVGQVPGARVFALVDGRPVAGTYGEDRPDVAKALGSAATARSGFRITLSGGLYKPGRHAVVIGLALRGRRAYEALGPPFVLELR